MSTNFIKASWILLSSIPMLLGTCQHARAQEGTRDPEVLDREAFFESRIRPLLIQHCYECHSADTEINGGLSLDAKAGWELGGDRGPALVPGEPDASLFMRAIEYKDPRLKMPPDGKLSTSAVEAFRRWIAEGAYDPRVEVKQALQKSKGLSLEESQKHWSYRPLERPALPGLVSGRNPRTSIDAFVEQKLESEGLSPAPPASRSVLLRRLKFDLHGLPPTSQEIRDFEEDADPNAYERLVDQLLASPRFGERMARRWLDVARFAESYTLRGFVMPEAWRYRDYCVQAFNGDLPWNQFVKEQLAGDLLQSASMEVRRREQTAVAFLLLGNNNLEEQDKDQLDMDVIDEQLETLGKAFLGQTIGCARCHDHKFDPIPTKDYYALAGILKSSVVLKHENVSKWIEVPLPVDESSDKHFKKIEQEHARVQAEVKKLEKGTKPDKGPSNNKMVAVESLEGLVIDDGEARKVGEWQSSTTIRPFVGSNYLHDGANGRGMKTITFEPSAIPPGKYEVRLAYAPGTNRASNALVRIFSADGEATKSIDQRAMPPIQDLWISLGHYRFEKDGQAFVLISNEGADGHVIADAVQFLRAEEATDKKLATKIDGANGDAVSPATPARPSVAEVAKRADQDKRLKELKETAKKLEAELSQRPMAMGLQTVAGKDIAVHIRGSVHALGEVVPRGFLKLSERAMSARGPSTTDQDEGLSSKAPDRRDLAEWMVDPRHPLTARVAANRVWYWLMGEGLVDTVDNFGTTGNVPSHPELLDYLAIRLIGKDWSIKELTKEILLSDTYMRSSQGRSDEARQKDPDNRLYAWGNRKRLDAECLRDAMLQISGQLDLAMGGRRIPKALNNDYGYSHSEPCRSLYVPAFRNATSDLLAAFDMADTSVSVGRRAKTTVAQQALIMLNHPLVLSQSRLAADRWSRTGVTVDELLEEIAMASYGRPLTETEKQFLLSYLEPLDRSDRYDRDKLAKVIQTIFASIDFRYVE